MILFFIVLSSVLVLGIIMFPLFFQHLIPYQDSTPLPAEFSEIDSALTSLTELEEDYQMGRVGNEDYHKLKIFFQQKYLAAKQSSAS